MSHLHPIDIITCIALLWAVVDVWRRGAILQCCTLAGLVAGILLAARYGRPVGTALGISAEWVAPAGFVVVLLGALIAVAFVGRLGRRIFRFAGLGPLDILLGIAFSLIKWMLLLSVLYTAFGALNRAAEIVEPAALHHSRTFRPVCMIAERLLPVVRQNLDLPAWEEWLPTPSTSQNYPS